VCSGQVTVNLQKKDEQGGVWQLVAFKGVEKVRYSSPYYTTVVQLLALACVASCCLIMPRSRVCVCLQEGALYVLAENSWLCCEVVATNLLWTSH